MEQSNNTTNSHIQITRSLLKNFQGNNKKLVYYNLIDNTIRNDGSPKKIGAEKGHFTDKIENYLNKEIECKVGDVFKEISNFSKNKNKELIIYNVNEIKRFVEYSIIRGKRYVEFIKEKLKLKEITKEEEKIVHNAIIECHQEQNILDDYDTTLFINKTDTKFVTLSNTIYYFIYEDVKWVFLPITPLVCIGFSKQLNNIINEYTDGDKVIYNCRYYNINEAQIVKKLNQSALITEMLTSNKFIVGSKEELEYLKKYKETSDMKENFKVFYYLNSSNIT